MESSHSGKAFILALSKAGSCVKMCHFLKKKCRGCVLKTEVNVTQSETLEPEYFLSSQESTLSFLAYFQHVTGTTQAQPKHDAVVTQACL